ncbi:DUF423 domain-containing protein [Azospirillum thermophilum]|uniref:DUF423 domain-containing protein n=2 Tax=Azospirillum thermophilum TaxID=2202148 RepID=A0A2S2CN02_9PROT|nr:DUF423 domain-containing protein [Azospirillum thermophilum]
MKPVDRIWLFFAALSGAMAVAAGAYASHGLAGDARAQELVRMAAQHQMWHGLALVALAALVRRVGGAGRLLMRVAGWLFIAGTILFSGTLYVLGLGGSLPIGMTAPTGGTTLITGWLLLAIGALVARAER